MVFSRGKCRICPHLGSIESVRAALASYAADSSGNTFPAAIDDWDALVALANENGARLKQTEKKQGFSLRRYTAMDSDHDGVFEDYTASFSIPRIHASNPGSLIFVSPGGIEKRRLLP